MVCVGCRVSWLIIKVSRGIAFLGYHVLNFIDFVGAIFVVGWVFLFASCASESFALAGGRWVVLTAFSADLVEAPAFRCVVSEFLAFEALYDLKLGVVPVRMEMLVVKVDSRFDASVRYRFFGFEVRFPCFGIPVV